MSDWKDKYRPKDYPNKDWPPLVYVGYADNEIAKLQADNKFLASERDEVAHQVCVLEIEVELAETVMRNHDCHDVWSDTIKEVER